MKSASGSPVSDAVERELTGDRTFACESDFQNATLAPNPN